MAKIKIMDLPKDMKISEQEMKKVLGGKRRDLVMVSLEKVSKKKIKY